MKAIQLKSLTLRNWRGEKERTTLFHTDGSATIICGANGLGKSRHMDAFCWLLFGKDCQERKDFNVRTQDDTGEPLHHCECSVEGTLIVDGKEIVIKREYKEQWVKPRGQVEEVFKGNVTECTWDGTPVRVNDFRSRISSEIIDETVFKLITNTDYFLSLKQDKQRELLLSIAGAKTDEELAQGNQDFVSLLGTLSGKSLSDYRKQVAAEKKRLKAAAAEISPRIDQVNKMMPEAENWSDIEKELELERKNLEHNNSLLHSQDARLADAKAKIMLLDNEKTIIKKNMQSVIDDAKENARKQADAKNQKRNELSDLLKKLNTDLSSLTISINHTRERIADCSQRIEQYNGKLTTLRQQWGDINKESFRQEDATCPCCGQPLTGDKLQEAKDKFTQHQQTRLSENVSTGKAIAAEKKSYEAELTQHQQALSDYLQQQANMESRLAQTYEQFHATPLVAPADVVPEDIPGYVSLQERLAEIEKELAASAEPTSASELSQTIAEIKARIRDLESRLDKRNSIAKFSHEIDRLMEHGRVLAQLIADCEQQEYIAAQFSRARIEDCESRLNSLFSTVQWKLFDTTLDGNEFETCIPMVNGIYYATCNTATQINAGIDIANTLATHYQVYAPMFIDRAESCNSFIACNSQIILLQVTTDKKLSVK